MTPSKLYDYIADALVSKGYCILPELLPLEMLISLQNRLDILLTDQLKPAGIGRKSNFQLNSSIRSDHILWLSHDDPVDNNYLNWMETFRLELNQRLYMGLFKYEAHYAHYPEGAFYQKHFDAFKGSSNRILTTLIYLNKNWNSDDGGHLLLYDKNDHCIERVVPTQGRFIIFLSDKFPHEVLTAKRDRLSIAGWFYINSQP